MAKRGEHLSEATKEKLRQANLGKKQSAEIVEKRMSHRRGVPLTTAHKTALSLSITGFKHTDEARAKMSVAKKGKPGRKLSSGEIENLRAVNMGKHHSTETKSRIGEAKKGQPGPWLGKKRGPHSPETRAKMSATAMGKPKSPEHVKNILSHRWTGKRYPYGGTNFRSTYEVRFATVLDALGIKWLYEPKRFDLGTCSYTPDFYVPQTEAYWETKGYFGEESQRKVSLFRVMNPGIPLVVVTKPILEMMERTG